MIIIATAIYLNVILHLHNAILPSACIWRWFKQKIAGAVASFALPPRVLQKGVIDVHCRHGLETQHNPRYMPGSSMHILGRATSSRVAGLDLQSSS